jgi:hypothetical protein
MRHRSLMMWAKRLLVGVSIAMWTVVTLLAIVSLPIGVMVSHEEEWEGWGAWTFRPVLVGFYLVLSATTAALSVWFWRGRK